MDETIQQESANAQELPEQAPAPEVDAAALELTADQEQAKAEYEQESEAEPEEEPDDIFFVSDFILTAEDFLETAQYAYLRVANNSLVIIGLIIVFAISCLTAGSTDYLLFLPVVALVITLTQVRRYSNTDKDIAKSFALMQSKTATGSMHYHIEFGEYMHITNNDRKTPKHDLGEITAICESAKYWLLCLDQQLYIPVEKGSVTGENPEEFLEYLRTCCKSLKNKKIAKIDGKKKQAAYAVAGCVIATVITLLIAFFLRK